MRFTSPFAVALLSANTALTAPSADASLVNRDPKQNSEPSTRPIYPIKPHQPTKGLPSSPPRHKICNVPSQGNGKDDSQYILDSIHACNNGGHVVFNKDSKYTIGTALDLTFLKHIDLGMRL